MKPPYTTLSAIKQSTSTLDADDTRSHIRVPSASNVEVDYFCEVVRRREARTTNGVEHGCANCGTQP